MGASDLLERLIGHDDQAAQNAWRVHFDELLDEVRPTDGAGDLLRDLHGRGLTVVLATSAPDDLLTHFRAKIGADNAIDDVVSARDVDRAKPHPDIFEAALSKAGAAPTDAIVIGDSVWDLEAAAAASLPCIGLETGGFSRCELDHCGAVRGLQGPTRPARPHGRQPDRRAAGGPRRRLGRCPSATSVSTSPTSRDNKAYYDALMPLLGYEPFFATFEEFSFRPVGAKPGTFVFFYGALEPAPYSRHRPGLQHLAFIVDDRAAVHRAYGWAADHGSQIVHQPQEFPQYHAGYYSAFWLDPDGFMLEAVCHRAAG